MTIKQQGGIFGRNPTFNDVSVDGDQNISGSLDVLGEVSIGQSGAVTELSFLRSSANYINASSSGGYFIFRTGGKTKKRLEIQDDGDVYFFDTAGSSPQMIYTASTSNLSFPSGSGIDFSATSGTGTSELFDDYEEGTWTPTGCGAGAVGVYTKMGDTVFAYCEVKANSVSTDTIGGLPFTVGSGNSAIGGYFGRARFAGIFDANGNEVRIRMLGTDIKFMNNGGLSGDAATTITTAGGGIVQLAISVIYKV